MPIEVIVEGSTCSREKRVPSNRTGSEDDEGRDHLSRAGFRKDVSVTK